MLRMQANGRKRGVVENSAQSNFLAGMLSGWNPQTKNGSAPRCVVAQLEVVMDSGSDRQKAVLYTPRK
jgi:hypothetical protein